MKEYIFSKISLLPLKLFFIIAILSLLAISCDMESSGNSNSSVRTFWAQDFVNGVFYELTAERLASNNLCEVWVERGSGITTAEAEEMANTYANNIYPKMMDTFGWKQNFTGYGTLDTMQYADALGDENGKLIILLLDIKDGYTGAENEGYVAGYFWGGNFFERNSATNSNESDMIYIDTNPGFKRDKDNVYKTLVHEMQHLMNFVTNNLLIGNKMRNSVTDLWIDEGLSEAAEWVYGGHSEYRIAWYNTDPLGTIAKGNNFFVWDQYENDSVLDDYATVYLFFQWLRLQKNTSIYNNIMLSNYYDHKAVTNAFGLGISDSSWSSLLGDWLAANYIGNSSGPYGYRDDTLLNSLKNHYIGAAPTASLYPGEGVYSFVTGTPFSSPSSQTNIRFLGLSSSDTVPFPIPLNGALLTYNENINNKATPNTGTLTGNPPPPPAPNIQTSVNNRSLRASSFSGQRIGAGDVLRRRGNYESFNTLPLNSGVNGRLSPRSSAGTKNPLIIEGEIMRYRDFPNE